MAEFLIAILRLNIKILKTYFKFLFASVFVLLQINTLYAQLTQQPTDCINSVIVCGDSNINLNVSGIGTQEINLSNACGSRENNSVWLNITLVTSGTLGFVLSPNSLDINEDYDFWVFGPNVSCNNKGQAIRCSTTNPQAAAQGNNLTGMNSTETDISEGPGALGNSFVSWLNVLAGETYFIAIDRPHGFSGFSLSWIGSAKFAEPPVNESGSGTALNLEDCDVVAPFEDGFTTFNLTDNTNSIIGTQTNADVSYHETESDANIGINEIRSPYTNTSNPQDIFVRITNRITGCFEVSQFELNVLIGPNFAEPTDFMLCDNLDDGDDTNGHVVFNLQSKNNEILDGQDPLDINITYHETQSDANLNIFPLSNLYYNTVSNFQQIFVRIESAFNPLCDNITPLNLVVNSLPETFNYTLIQCDEDDVTDGFTIFNLTEANDVLNGGIANRSTKFFLSLVDAQNDTGEINSNAFNNTVNPQTIYVQVINDDSGCINFAELILDVSLTNANDAVLTTCDDDGSEDGFYSFNLTDANVDVLNGLPPNVTLNYYETYNDALLEQNPLANSYINTVAYNHVIYVRVENDNACYGINQVQLTVFELPDIIVEDESLYCLNFFPQTIILSSGIVNNLPSNYSYLWSTGEITADIEVNQPGSYSITVTNGNGCTKDRTITVLRSNIATIESIEVFDISENNTITVNVSGEGDFGFALDDINGSYQGNNFFENVAPGFHTVYVRDDKNNCGIVDQLVSVIGFPQFFTPNQDSYNDTWQVYGVSSQFQPNTKIYIFDRYGKLLKQLDPLGPGWDGTFNGQNLPSNDYWFQVTLQDGRVFKSHFTLKH